MRSETKDRLERALWRRRLGQLGLGAVAAILAGGVFWLEDLDRHVENRHVAGRVEHVGPLPSKDARTGVLVDVVLDDGRHAEVIALKTADPHVGERVTITEHHHASGRTTFTWR